MPTEGARVMTRIGILEVGRPPEPLRGQYPDYTVMIDDWLADMGGQASYYPVMDGIGLPDINAADYWVVTGSRCGVYEDHPWILPLTRFIQEAQSSSVKMLGICFGHQIIAHALGGKVERSHKGWGVGLHHYDFKAWPEHLPNKPSSLRIAAFHQDQVVQAPPQAKVIAGSDFCPVGALWYPGFAVSFQVHPEFDEIFEADVIRFRTPSLLSESVSTTALNSLDNSTTRHDLAQWLVSNWHQL